MKAPQLHQDSDSSSTKEWKQDIETQLKNATKTFNLEKTESWRQALETILQATLNTAITTFKDDMFETISTTKGELLTQLDTLRVDMKKQEQDINIRTLRKSLHTRNSKTNKSKCFYYKSKWMNR
jgi:hypothetical protein